MNPSFQRLSIAAALTLAIPLAGCGPSKSELANEINTLKEQLAQRQTEGKSLEQQVASARSEIETDRKALTDARAAASAASRELADIKASAEAAGQALEQARADRTIRDNRITELERDSRQLAQALETRTADHEKLRAELARISDAARQSESDLRQNLDASRSAERKALTERDLLAAEVTSMRGRLETLETTLQRASSTLADEQKKASDLTDRLAAAVREQSGLRQTSDAQRSEIASISAALADAQAKVALLTGARGIYTVQDGDSLSSIALYFYRNAHRWPGIAQANRHLINHPDRIFPAMVLIVPR